MELIGIPLSVILSVHMSVCLYAKMICCNYLIKSNRVSDIFIPAAKRKGGHRNSRCPFVCTPICLSLYTPVCPSPCQYFSCPGHIFCWRDGILIKLGTHFHCIKAKCCVSHWTIKVKGQGHYFVVCQCHNIVISMNYALRRLIVVTGLYNYPV